MTGHRPHKDRGGKCGRSWGAVGIKSQQQKSQAGAEVREVGGRPTPKGLGSREEV